MKSKYKCSDCGHEQLVSEVHDSGRVWAGSGANWCDLCNGKPVRVEPLQVEGPANQDAISLALDWAAKHGAVVFARGGLPALEGLNQWVTALREAHAAQDAQVQVWQESACALIKAADDAAADNDYMLDSDDCIKVLRGEWKGPLLNDCPKQAEPVKPTVWQPIETAPTDGKRTLYLAKFSETGELLALDFDGIWEYWQESWELQHINGYAWSSANGLEEPTHWAYQDEPIPSQRKLLTDAEIIDIRRKTTAKSHGEWADTKAFARALEAKLNS